MANNYKFISKINIKVKIKNKEYIMKKKKVIIKTALNKNN